MILSRNTEPTSRLNQLQLRMNDLFNSLSGGVMDPLQSWETANGSAWSPSIDLTEDDDAFVVKAEVPGMDPDDVHISVQGDTLTIEGEKREEREEGDANETWHLKETRTGKFRRSFSLPTSIDAQHIKATDRNGVIVVTVPKKEKVKPRRIEVKKKK